MLATVLLVATTMIAAPVAPAVQPKNNLKTQFELLDDAGKHDDVVKLFRENRGRVMYMIDSYLEGSLADFEKSGGNPSDEVKATIAKKHARALSSARAASEAFGSPDILDYASSFVGWNSDEKKQFRTGQKECGASGKALKAKEFDKALEHAQAGLNAAWPLGDWWGTGMAMSAMGRAYRGLGKPGEAVKAISTARLLYDGLALDRSAYRMQLEMVPLLMELGRHARAKATIASAMAAANRYNDAKAKVTLLESRALLEEKMGDSAAAEATRRELEAAKKAATDGDK